MRRPLFIARQASHPSGLLGWLIGWVMSYETAGENAKTLELLKIQAADHLLEIGFGHGRTIAQAVALAPRGHVAGVDVSEQMVDMARAYNKEAVREGRVTLERTAGAHLPYADARFDKVYSVHTIYFWADAPAWLREICRVLKPAGRLVLTLRHGDAVVAELPAPIYVHRSPGEVVALLREAGFTVVAVDEDPPLYFVVSEKTI